MDNNFCRDCFFSNYRLDWFFLDLLDARLLRSFLRCWYEDLGTMRRRGLVLEDGFGLGCVRRGQRGLLQLDFVEGDARLIQLLASVGVGPLLWLLVPFCKRVGLSRNRLHLFAGMVL